MAKGTGFTSSTADVTVVGNGLIGRSCAVAIASRGATVALIGENRAGQASSAAAGMLAPSVERADGPAHEFAIRARDRYPSYIEWLEESTGIRVPLNRLGVLQLALSPHGVRGLKRSLTPPSVWLEKAELAGIEPSLGHALGAVYSPDDGAVDNVALLAALDVAVAASDRITRIEGGVTSVSTPGRGARATLADGRTCESAHLVLAAGAWCSQIEGARLASAVRPMRGQLISFVGAPARHILYGPRGYLVPRGGSVIAGSTMEAAGFASQTTPEGIRRVRSIAEEVFPGFAGRPPDRAWAGLRPVTPDLLPLLGPDPDSPPILYATGHSRNGVLMAPLTADCVVAMVFEDSLNLDLSQFRPDRF